MRLVRPLALLLVAATVAKADVRLPAIFSDHAVLLRSEHTAVWGWADPGEQVKILLGSVNTSVRATDEGRWRAALDLQKIDEGPHELVVEGRNRIVARDVLVGEVWLCSGQSNMEWKVAGSAEAAEERARPQNPRLRQFLIRRTASENPREDCDGRWTVAGPETVGDFTAVGYFFGRAIAGQTGHAIGLINATWGGSPVEAWMSASAIAADPELHSSLQRQLSYERDFPSAVERYDREHLAWAKRFARDDRAENRAASPGELDAAPWQSVSLPGIIAPPAFPESGIFWLRRKVQIPAHVDDGLERGFLLSVGTISGHDEVYWNGVKIGAMNPRQQGLTNVRRYPVPASLVEPGREAQIDIRVYEPAGPLRIAVSSDDLFAAGAERIHGEWQVHVERAFPPLDATARSSRPKQPLRPRLQATRHFNGMIAPVAPYGVRGVLWYQGEANTGRAAQYRTTFPQLIANWRALWQTETLPFYFCQLANYRPKITQPGESTWAELRESQSATLRIPNTGQAVLIDLGEEKDIHPRRKREVGERLARLALSRDYRVAGIVANGPVFRESVREGNRLRVRFDGVEGGLHARPLPETYRPKSTETIEVPLVLPAPESLVQGFAICGPDRKWHWAQAQIENDTVVVWSDAVPEPIAVRYAWADNPTCNLYNGAGLPASPFRTDEFPAITANAKF